MISIVLSVVAVGIATTGLAWTWLFRNYAIITANWLDDLIEYLSSDDEENKFKYEINGITTDLLPKVEHVEYHCMKRFIPFAIVWALAVTHMLMGFAGVIDPYIVVVTFLGVAYVASVLYTDHNKYLYLQTEMIAQQLTFDMKTEADDHTDA